MYNVIAEVKKWGNSLGIILPMKKMDNLNIKPGDKISIEISKKVDFSNLFGTLKFDKSTQELKDEIRKGWKK